MAGWIKLHRQMLEWEWYDDANTSRLFIHCLLRANHADNKWRGIEIKRGTFLTSLDTLSKETGLSVSQIRTSIKKLISTGELASKSQATSRVITVVQYDQWQGCDKQTDRLMTSESQGSDKGVTTNKNVKNENNEKNEKKKDLKDLPSKRDDVNEIFEYWKLIMGKSNQSKLTKERAKKIKDRMTEGYTAEEIKAAVLGCSLTPHNMGSNTNGKVYDDIELICRTGGHLERFANNSVSHAKPAREFSEAAEKTINNIMSVELK